MSLRAKLFSFFGDIHVVKALTFPPCFMIGEHKRKVDLSLDYRAATKLLQPGDILVSRSWGYFLSNKGIPGAFKHAMVYVGAVKGRKDAETGFIKKPKMMPSMTSVYQTLTPRCVVHAISDGVVCQDLIDVMTHCDYMAAFRPLSADLSKPFDLNVVAAEACKLVGTPYNFDFAINKNAFYCTELVNYLADKSSARIPPKTSMRVSLFGAKSMVTLADSISLVYSMPWCSVSCNEPAFVNKSKIPDVIRNAVYDAEDGFSLEELGVS
jgi:hypothetical protein